MKNQILLLTILITIGLQSGLAPYGTKFKYVTDKTNFDIQKKKGYDIKPWMQLVDCKNEEEYVKLSMTKQDFNLMCEAVNNPWFAFMHHGKTMTYTVMIILLSTVIILFLIENTRQWYILGDRIFTLILDIIFRYMFFLIFGFIDMGISKYCPKFDASDHAQMVVFFCLEMTRIRKMSNINKGFLSYIIDIIPIIISANSLTLTVQYYHTEAEVIIGFVIGIITVTIIDTVNNVTDNKLINRPKNIRYFES